MTRKQLDDALPTIVRYVGVAIAVALTVANITGFGSDFNSGYVLAAGMILYKGLASGMHERNGNDA